MFIRNASKAVRQAELASVRALILALSRFEIASRDKTHVLEKDWAIYRKNRRLTGEGKVVAEMPEICPH